MVRWPILAGPGLCAALLASPAPALADDPLYTCAKVAADAKLTIPFTPDRTLHDLGVWVTGFTCKSVVYDGEAAARATKLALIAPSSVTPKQAVQLFVDTVQKAGLAVAEKPDAFVISLLPAAQRRCPTPPSAPRTGTGSGACAPAPAGAKLAISMKPDVTLEDLARWVTGFTCKPVAFDPKIATGAVTVSVIVSARITPRQATRLFVDAVESTGLTVAEKAGGFEVSPGPRWAHCTAGARPPGVLPSPPSPPSPDPDVDLDAVLAAGIRKIDATHYEIKRAALDAVLGDPMAIARSARVVPSMKNGNMDGFKLFGIRPGTLSARLGLLNGDTLRAINGLALDEPDKALEVYTKLRTATALRLELERQGKPLTLSIQIVK
jgi:hypothetical protein